MNLQVEEELVKVIETATRKALRNLFNYHKERFYYCSLITTGEGLCPVISAWSEEALEHAAGECSDEDKEEARYYLKWSSEESPYYAYGEEHFEEVKEVFLARRKALTAEDDIDREIQLRINSMEKVMSNLDQEGMFGVGQQRLCIVINAEFMPPDYTNTERALRLNPRAALDEWLDEIAEEIEE